MARLRPNHAGYLPTNDHPMYLGAPVSDLINNFEMCTALEKVDVNSTIARNIVLCKERGLELWQINMTLGF